MKISRASTLLSVAVGVTIVLTGCSSSGSDSSPSTPLASRDASARGSHLCILNDTGKTLPMVREFGPFATGDHHPDPAGPLAPGATWCTHGYNSYTKQGRLDVTAEILFTDDGSEKSHWAASNIWSEGASLVYDAESGDAAFNYRFTPAFSTWEVDSTIPKRQPNHEYHIRRLDDSEFFKEWLVTVRR